MSTISEADPENKMFARFGLQRLDAESIRDAIVAVSGPMDDRMYGPGFNPNSNDRRRAVYVRSKRNSMDKLLATFDSPTPFATTGRRNATNVPAQSLTLMNSRFVLEMASQWATRVKSKHSTGKIESKVATMFESALGRKPSEKEVKTLVQYYERTNQENGLRDQNRQKHLESLRSHRDRLAKIMDPARAQLIDQDKLTPKSARSATSKPLAHWKFSESETDLISGKSLQLKSGAKIENGALILEGSGFALSDPINKPLGSHSLEAWVQLDSLKQKGGGIVGVQSLDGNVFDSIVFAEKEPKRWLAGSELHRRTLDFGGEAEKDARTSPVHLVLTYAEGGTITGYRNGKPYGKPIRKSDLMTFAENQWQITLGIRHGVQGSPGRLLQGSIAEARVFGHALGESEVLALYQRRSFVTDDDVLQSLEDDQRNQAIQLRKTISQLEQSTSKLVKPNASDDALTCVAHAIFNLKEFIYLR